LRHTLSSALPFSDYVKFSFFIWLPFPYSFQCARKISFSINLGLFTSKRCAIRFGTIYQVVHLRLRKKLSLLIQRDIARYNCISEEKPLLPTSQIPTRPGWGVMKWITWPTSRNGVVRCKMGLTIEGNQEKYKVCFTDGWEQSGD
jgi:hypothetical protein